MSLTLQTSFVVGTTLHGTGTVIYSWHPSGQYVASTGSSRVVHVFQSDGQVASQIVPPSPSMVKSIEWSPDGEILAIVQASSPIVVLWEMATQERCSIDTNFKDLTFLKWSPDGERLAIGTAKGALLFYDKTTLQRYEAAGRHKKRIICGAWNQDGDLAFASDDRQITICSGRSGETVDQVKVKHRPQNVSFGGQRVVSCTMDGRSLLLYTLREKDNALELAFQKRYGNIVSYFWYGDGYIMAGFSSGFIVVISTQHDVGQEQFCAKFHEDGILDIAHCPEQNIVATCGNKCVKLIDMADWKEIFVWQEVDNLDSLAWADSGRILSVSSKKGRLYNLRIRTEDSSVERYGGDVALLMPISTSRFLALVAYLFFFMMALATWHLDISFKSLCFSIFGFVGVV